MQFTCIYFFFGIFSDINLCCFKQAGNILCVVKTKFKSGIYEGFAQIIKQLESSHEVNEERQGQNDFGIYGILTSCRDWHFLLYDSNKRIFWAGKVTIEFDKEALDENSEEYKTLCMNVRKVLGAIVGLIKGRDGLEHR